MSITATKEEKPMRFNSAFRHKIKEASKQQKGLSLKTLNPFNWVQMLLSYVFGDSIKKGVDIVSNIIKNKVFYTVSLDILRYNIDSDIMIKMFKRMPVKYSYGTKSGHLTIDKMIANNEGTFIDYIIFEGTRIFYILDIEEGETSNNSGAVRSYLTCINTRENIKKLDKFILKLMEVTEKIRDKRLKSCYYNKVDSGMTETSSTEIRELPKRTFDDVFIPADQRYQLINTISKFIANRKWYEDHKIPYHLGILLHGEGGTGKTSIIQAICNEFDADIFYTTDIMDGEMTAMVRAKISKRPTIIITEDIDTLDFTNRRQSLSTLLNGRSDDDKEKPNVMKKLGQLLNYIDGFDSIQNVIYIFTTNHIENLDEALIRPGRIDLCMEIKKVTDETIRQFIYFHYKERPRQNVIVKPNMTFAELQVLVMKGYSYEEFCKHVFINPAKPQDQPSIGPVRPGFQEQLIEPPKQITVEEINEEKDNKSNEILDALEKILGGVKFVENPANHKYGIIMKVPMSDLNMILEFDKTENILAFFVGPMNAYVTSLKFDWVEGMFRVCIDTQNRPQIMSEQIKAFFNFVESIANQLMIHFNGDTVNHH